MVEKLLSDWKPIPNTYNKHKVKIPKDFAGEFMLGIELFKYPGNTKALLITASANEISIENLWLIRTYGKRHLPT